MKNVKTRTHTNLEKDRKRIIIQHKQGLEYTLMLKNFMKQHNGSYAGYGVSHLVEYSFK